MSENQLKESQSRVASPLLPRLWGWGATFGVFKGVRGYKCN